MSSPHDTHDHPSVVASLRARLAEHDAADDRERAAIDEIQRWLDSCPRPFDQHAATVHVTASAIVLDHPGASHVLLHHHKRLATWLQPGAHIDAAESPADAALRETREETGIRARHAHVTPALIHVDAHPGPRGHRHLDLRYLALTDGRPRPAPRSGESPIVRWFPVTSALRTGDPSLAAAIRAALRAIGRHG